MALWICLEKCLDKLSLKSMTLCHTFLFQPLPIATITIKLGRFLRYIFLFLVSTFLFSEPFKVATYNVQNLFDAEYVGTEYDDYTLKHNWTKRMVDIKLNHVSEVICDLDADILGLQEIENANIFEQLKKRLSRVGCGYRYSAITSKKDAPIQVALLSRFPIKT